MRTKPLLIGSLLISLLLFINNLSIFGQTCATCPGNTVTGIKASAFGYGNTASGNYSFVAGRNSTASMPYSGVLGSWSSAEGGHSFAIGGQSHAKGDFSFVLGDNSTAEFDYSIAIGHNISANTGGFALGYGKIDALLTNNIEKSLVIGFNSAYPTLFVSRTPYNQQSGRIGIGNVTDPQAKLHIRADEGEDASLFLEASAGGQAKLMLSESHEIAYEPDENLHFRTAQSNAFVFHQGDIFIEDIQSGIIMRSPNGQCWRGRVNDQGLLAFEQTECPTAATALPEHGRENHLMRVFPNPASKQLEVVAEGLNGSYTLRLISATGQLMLEKQSREMHTQLNIQNLSSGTYLLLLEQDGKMKDSVKVLVE